MCRHASFRTVLSPDPINTDVYAPKRYYSAGGGRKKHVTSCDPPSNTHRSRMAPGKTMKSSTNKGIVDFPGKLEGRLQTSMVFWSTHHIQTPSAASPPAPSAAQHAGRREGLRRPAQRQIAHRPWRGPPAYFRSGMCNANRQSERNIYICDIYRITVSIMNHDPRTSMVHDDPLSAKSGQIVANRAKASA